MTPNELLASPSSAQTESRRSQVVERAGLTLERAGEGEGPASRSFARELQARRAQSDLDDNTGSTLAEESKADRADKTNQTKQSEWDPAADATREDSASKSSEPDQAEGSERTSEAENAGNPIQPSVTSASTSESTQSTITTPTEATQDAQPINATQAGEVAAAAQVGVATSVRSSQRAKVEYLSSQAVLAQTRIDLASQNAAALRTQAEPSAESGTESASQRVTEFDSRDSARTSPATQADSQAHSQRSPAESIATESASAFARAQAAAEGPYAASPASPSASQRSEEVPAHVQPQPALPSAARSQDSQPQTLPGQAAVVQSTSAREAPDTRTTDATPRATPGISAASSGARGSKAAAFQKLSEQARPSQDQVQQARVQQAAVRGVAMAFQAGGGDATITLAPETLGRLRVHVQVREGSVEATFRTTTREAFEALQGSKETLRATLESQGMQIERIIVEPPPLREASTSHQESIADQRTGTQSDAGSQGHGQGPPQQHEQDRGAFSTTEFGTPSALETDADTTGWSSLPGASSSVLRSDGVLEWVA
jgi:flagellar hook-length control protein FliK